MYNEQREMFNEYSSTFPPDIVAKWCREVEAWYESPTADNSPFELAEKRKCSPYRCTSNTHSSTDTTMKDIIFSLSQEDAAELSRGSQQWPNDLSPSYFIKLGIELEEQQCVSFRP